MISIPIGVKEVVLVEDREQLETLRAAGALAGDGVIALALTPGAEYAAERAALRSVPFDALYSEAALREAGDDNVDRAQALCGYLDQHLRAQDSGGALAGFSAHDLFYWMRTLLDSVFERCWTLAAALDRLTPRRVSYVERQTDVVADDLFFRGRALTPAVLPAVAAPRQIEVRTVPAHRRRAPAAARSRRFRLSDLRDAMAFAGWVATRRAPDDEAILVPLGEGYDLGPIVRAWRAGGRRSVPFRALRWKLEGRRASAGSVSLDGVRLFAAIAGDSRIRALFEFGQTSAFPVVRSRFEHLAVRVLPALAARQDRARSVLRAIRRPLVVGTPAVGPSQLAVLAAARSLGAPTALHQHGGGYGVLELPMVEHHELALADHFIAYGPGASEFYDTVTPLARRHPARPRARVVPAGSPALEALARRTRGRPRDSGAPRTAIYVTTNFSGDIRYFDHRTYPDLGYWRLQQDVVRRCAARSDVRLVIKLHLSDHASHPMRLFVRDQGFDNCEVVGDRPFTDLLDRADLFIIDYPSSTALLQALTTERRILTLFDQAFTRPDPKAVERLRRRAVVATSRAEFLQQLDAALDDADWTPRRPIDNDFLHQYGIGIGESPVASSIDRLLDIAAHYRPPVAGLQTREVTTV